MNSPCNRVYITEKQYNIYVFYRSFYIEIAELIMSFTNSKYLKI